ncbi:MAG: putative transport system permease protein [Thermodesulfobacteriota bacterium]|nr:putative transport system permease protein [Thermodesulfobacteriota bacterium]
MAIPISYGIRNVKSRKITSVMTAGGMALVSFVFSAVLMLANGLEQTLTETGSPENAIILRGSAETEVSSVIEREAASVIELQPETAQNSTGEYLVAKEALVLVTLPKKVSEKPTNVMVRGIGPQSMALRPQVKLVEGRYPRPGSREVMAGKSISDTLKDGGLGSKLHFALADWDVVGLFDAGRTGFSSEIWTDADQLMSAFRRNAYSAVLMRVPGDGAFASVKTRLEGDPRLSVDVKRETAFYLAQSEVMAKFIRILGLAMTIFFSIGAILGAMVTMYTAVANRTREIGTLRALGFQRTGILFSFLIESLFLGLVGGLAGVGASSSLQLLTISTLNWETFSELAFSFRLTLSIAVSTVGFSVMMGLLGGMLPAWRGSQLNIVDALRS